MVTTPWPLCVMSDDFVGSNQVEAEFERMLVLVEMRGAFARFLAALLERERGARATPDARLHLHGYIYSFSSETLV